MPRSPSRLPRIAFLASAALLGLGGGWAWGWGQPRWVALRDASNAMVDAHVAHDVSHPGWSFPARIWSDSASLDQPRDRLVAQARLRGYAEVCPPERPGEICPKTGDVLLRGGRFPEGMQPPGNTGWTRAPALEPVLVGTLLGPDGEIREHLPLADAPEALVTAILTSEDEAFRSHRGVNLRGAARAAWVNLQGGAVRQGASTLTMQVVRNLGQDKARTWQRKAREALAAFAVDAHLGKDGVLQIYLDAPYLGQSGSQSICGFQAAARYYWGVDAKDLSLARAATLAAILPAPGRWSPDSHPEEARARRDALLRRMADKGWDGTEVDAALAEPMDASPHPLPPDRWPPYLQATRAWLEDHLEPGVLYGAGLEVFTALDPLAQDITDRVLPERLHFLEQTVGRNGREPLQVAAALLDLPSGLLVAAHDPRMKSPTDFSRVTQIRRQSGSAIKPLVYGLAFSRLGPDGHPKITAAHTLPNQPRTFAGTNGWRPLNVGDDYSDTSTLAMGLAWSQNIVAAGLLEEEGGPRELIAFGQKLGFDTSAWPVEMGLSLGQAEVHPLEMVRLAATFARGGVAPSARPVVVAVDAAGRQRIGPDDGGTRVLSEESAALMRELMRLVTTYGTAYTIKGVDGHPGYTRPAMGKTGTSDDEKDLWFTGATPLYAGALWMGYETPARVGGTAGDLVSPLWGWWMRALEEDLEPGTFVGPEVPRHPICTQSGLAPNATCRIINAPFLPGTAPRGGCTLDHPPPPPDKKPFENLWQKRARLAGEKAAAEAVGLGGGGAGETSGEVVIPQPGG